MIGRDPGDVDALLARFANPPGAADRVSGPHAFAEVAGAVEALRTRVYATSMPHLLSPEVRDLEARLALDGQAEHFCAWTADGALSATLRVTLRPLELPQLSDRCADLVARHPRHGEISRVITDPGHRRRDHLTRVFAAMVRALLSRDADGVLGVCRRRVARFYGRFGLAPVHDDPLALPGRPTPDYFVVAATLEHMVEVGMHRLYPAGEDRVGPVP